MQISTITELRSEVEQVESKLGIESDIRIPLRARVSHVLTVAGEKIKHNQPITHGEIAGYIGNVYYLKDLEISGDVLCNTDTYQQRRNEKGQFSQGIETIRGDEVY